ncbi:hypothetical protein KR093_010250 [Drosophila rubida]|uniref:Uncharacterized protein n=1 Tax=Drosophila rubida TaxID=30044 RepID=A0AAD4JUQ3_9MUSC|nr:hypothetical protein KR093_010250 [Drosophila rubida]
MSKTWLTWAASSLWLSLFVLVLELGPCQCQLAAADAWSKSDVLDVFATAPQLASEASGAHTIQQSHDHSNSNSNSNSNNVTLTDEPEVEAEEDLDLAAPKMPLSQRKLSRGKRFVAFPLGSSASVSVCFTVGIIGNPYYGHNSFGLNWGVAYDLPNNTWILQSLHGFSQRPVAAAILRRRTRNAIYQDIETIVDNMGYNGRDCILRTLCESRQYFQRTKLNMVGEMLRTIFSLPKQRIFKRELQENSDIVHYDNAYRHAHEFDCAQQYDCQFSLLELAFGKYSTPPQNYYAQ